jgi:hypothetical protein
MPKIRNILIFVAIVVVLILGYFLFIKSSSSNQASLVSSSANTGSTSSSSPASTNGSGTAGVTEDFLSTLLSINTIKLDTSIFSNPAFSSLRDSSITLVPDSTQGRPNPFAQFGNDGVSTSTSSTIITSTPSTTSSTVPVSTSKTTPSPSTPNTETAGKTINQ